jgi:hypothetical protein
MIAKLINGILSQIEKKSKIEGRERVQKCEERQ